MTYRRDLWELAAGNHGIVTTRQADDVGVPAVEVRKLAARNALERVGQGVYRHLDVPADGRTDLAAALAIAGDAAFLEGDTVLSMFDLALVNPTTIHVGTTRRRRNKTPAHMIITVRPAVAQDDVTEYEGLRCVTIRRALLDGAGHLLGERVVEAVAQAQRLDLIDDLEATEILGAVAGRDRRLSLAS